MKDRSLRRHQDFKAKTKSKKSYNSCIQDLSPVEREHLNNNADKLRKVCVASHFGSKDVSGRWTQTPVAAQSSFTMRKFAVQGWCC
jgi:hypothetical protein